MIRCFSLSGIVLATVAVLAFGLTNGSAAAGPAQALNWNAKAGHPSLVHKVQGRRGMRRMRSGFRRPGAFRPDRVQARKRLRRHIRRRYWGRRVFGVVLGTAIAVSVAGAVPPRPSPELCWNWDDDGQVSGHWYYCNEP
jgi:hypothetical protein